MPRLVLASGSPRRRDLLETLRLEFESRSPEVEELRAGDETPEAYVRRLSVAKAEVVGTDDELVLAADTIVVLEDEILEKPVDESHAAAMLRSLSGREHRVLTGVTLRDVTARRAATGVAESRVRLRQMTVGEIEWYVATGESADKAGGYALQGIGGLFVDGIEGSSSNVIGLPLTLVYDLFARLGYDLKRFSARRSTSGAVDTLAPG